MKKSILFTLAALTGFSAFAQRPVKENSIYVRAGIGYATALAGSYTFMEGLPVNGTGTELSTTPGAYSFDINKASFGSGVSASAGFGYMFTPHMGIDLGVNVGLAMKKYEYKESSPGNYSATRTSYAKTPVLVMPSLVLATGGEQLNAYTRVGIVAAVAGKFIAEDYISASMNSQVRVTETINKLSVGFSGTIGAKYYVADGLAIFGELNATYLEMNAKSSEVTELSLNGVNYLGQLPISERSTEYSEKFVLDASASNLNMPANMQPLAMSYSNVGITIGISIEL